MNGAEMGSDYQEQFWLCELTGELPVDGACPEHGGDNCIARYDHFRESESEHEQ